MKKAMEEIQQELQLLNESMYQLILSSVNNGILITDPDGYILEANHALLNLTGYNRQDLIKQKASILNSGHQDKKFFEKMWKQLLTVGYWQGEIWNRKNSGEINPEILTINAIKNSKGELLCFVGVFSDTSLIRQDSIEPYKLAFYDPLTQLINAKYLMERLQHEIHEVDRTAFHYKKTKQILIPYKLAVLYIDLDDFKLVNEKFSYAIGDDILIEVAKRLQIAVRKTDLVARMTSDEFVIVLKGIHKQSEVAEICQKIHDILSEPMHYGKNSVEITARFGASIYPDDGAKPLNLVKQAKTAMRKAKASDGNLFFEFHTSAV